MRRSLAVSAVFASLLVLPAGAHAATGSFFAGQAVDGPSPDIQRLGDVDVARDGTGALVYVKQDGGVNHIFVSRLVNGAWEAPERIDNGLAGPSSQPVIAASDGGRLAIAFINDTQLVTVVRPTGDQPYGPPSGLAAPASNPSIDMSINGVAYVSFTLPGSSAADVRAARLERKGTTFAVLPDALDVDPAQNAGDGNKRSKVAVAADGSAVVVFGEDGSDGRTHVYGRRLFEMRVSTAPQDLTLSDFEGHAAGAADLPDIGIEDDSSFAWVVFRQAMDDGAGGVKIRTIARRLVGSQFEAPVAVDGQGFPTAESTNAPRVAVSGRGDGYAATAGVTTTAAIGAVIKDDAFVPGVTLGGGFNVAPFPVPAVAETGDGLVAWAQGDAGGGISLHAKAYDSVPASRVPQVPGPDQLLSSPDLGQVDGARGIEAAADRTGDIVVAFVQGGDADRKIVAAAFARAPGTFLTYTPSRWRKFARPPLRWSQSFELWGPVTYRVEIDGRPVAQTSDTSVTVPGIVRDGLHRWRVVAVDRRGQTTATATHNLRVDATPPKLKFTVSGARRAGGAVKVGVSATDHASGVKLVRIDFGDKSRAVVGRSATHRYGRAGKFTIRVTASDNVGNVGTVQRRVTIK
ncbi:MAG: hypothetical protein JWO74_3285 [Solirubrobacterales bacterium]|nr:hypothetical protein [Solirubrobacterales bacterium]